jgi:hypothetical protein
MHGGWEANILADSKNNPLMQCGSRHSAHNNDWHTGLANCTSAAERPRLFGTSATVENPLSISERAILRPRCRGPIGPSCMLVQPDGTGDKGGGIR